MNLILRQLVLIAAIATSAFAQAGPGPRLLMAVNDTIADYDVTTDAVTIFATFPGYIIGRSHAKPQPGLLTFPALLTNPFKYDLFTIDAAGNTVSQINIDSLFPLVYLGNYYNTGLLIGLQYNSTNPLSPTGSSLDALLLDPNTGSSTVLQNFPIQPLPLDEYNSFVFEPVKGNFFVEHTNRLTLNWSLESFQLGSGMQSVIVNYPTPPPTYCSVCARASIQGMYPAGNGQVAFTFLDYVQNQLSVGLTDGGSNTVVYPISTYTPGLPGVLGSVLGPNNLYLQVLTPYNLSGNYSMQTTNLGTGQQTLKILPYPYSNIDIAFMEVM